MDVPALRRFLHIRQADFVAAMVAIGGVVLFGPLPGLGIAIATSLLSIIYRSSSPRMEVLGKIEAEKAAWGRMKGHTTRQTVPGIVVVRLDAPLFWANATAIEDRLLDELDNWPGTHSLVLDLEATSQLSSTAADMLEHLHGELAARNVTLFLARVIHPVSSVLGRAGFLDLLGEDHIWHSISQCVRAARKQFKKRKRALSEAAPTESAVLEPVPTSKDGNGDDNDETITLGFDEDIEVVDAEDNTDDDAYAGRTRADELRDNVVDLYMCALHEGRPRDSALSYLSPDLIQHSTGIAGGADGFMAHTEQMIERYPELSVDVALVIADGPLCFLQLVFSDDADGRQWVTTEFFAADEDDRIVEHWSVVAPSAAQEWLWSSGPDDPPDGADNSRTEDNKKLVRSMIEDDLIRHMNTGTLDDYFATVFVESCGSLPDGQSALWDAVGAGANASFVYNELVMLVGEGDYVATLCRATWSGIDVAHVDIFGMEGGRIAEHWDNTEVVPPKSERVNAGPF